MSYQVKIRHSIDEVDPTEWECLTNSVPFQSRHWHHFASQVSDEKQLFFLLYESDKLVGAATANLSGKFNMTLSSPFAQRLTSGLLRRYPLLLCQRHLANMNGLILPKGDELAALRVLSAAMRSVVGSSFIALGYLSQPDQDLVGALHTFDYLRMDNSTVLPIVWSSFEDYTQSLGKSARKDMNRHNNKARDLKISIELTHHFTEHTDRLLELIGNVFEHHRSESENTTTRQLFTEFERLMPDNCTMMLARVDGVLAGCGLLIYDQGVMGQAFLGLDYKYQYIYFQLFYTAIRYAIENNIRLIRSGTGAYEFKRSLGFKEEPAYIAFTSRTRALRWVGNYLAKSVNTTSEQELYSAAT